MLSHAARYNCQVPGDKAARYNCQVPGEQVIKVQLPSTRRAYARVTPRVPTEYQAQRCGDAGFQYQARLCRKQRYQAMYHTEPTPGVSPRDPNMWSTGSERMRKNHVTRMQCIHIKSRTHVRNCQAHNRKLARRTFKWKKRFGPPPRRWAIISVMPPGGCHRRLIKRFEHLNDAASPCAVLHRPIFRHAV